MKVWENILPQFLASINCRPCLYYIITISGVISYHKQSGLLKTQGYHQVAIQVHSLLVVLRLNKKAILECT